jgi:hypothetical protein
MKKFTILLTTIILLTDCSITKRRYLSGYKIQWNFKIKEATVDSKKKLEESNAGLSPQKEINNDEYLASTAYNSLDFFCTKYNENTIKGTRTNFKKKNDCYPLSNPRHQETCGDIITLKNGDEILAKVIEINTTEIKYKRCDNLEGPLNVIRKSEVFSIKYSNGTKEIIKNVESGYNNNLENRVRPTGKTTHWAAITGFICSLIGLSVLGIIFGFLGLEAIKKDPSTYKGTELANAAIVIGLIVTVIILLVVFL